jgi:hypothetical protein
MTAFSGLCYTVAMNKKARVLLNIVLIVALIGSLAWGTFIRWMGEWGTRSFSSWWNDDIFWANVCQILIPVGIVIVLIFINKKK